MKLRLQSLNIFPWLHFVFKTADINECLTNNGGCGDVSIGECSNYVGSFSCQCKQGYTGIAPNCTGN